MVAQKSREIHVLLHDIRSTHNVGAIFRTADATGVSKIFLSGYTPAPLDRFGRPRQDISKASLGAEKTVVWESVADVLDLIQKLKKEGVQICAIEQHPTSISYKEIPRSDRILLVFGNEVDGVDEKILKLSDVIAEIPMLGEKESLNVSVTAGIILYQML
jgi:tRNA G18 (ribose-2'-O)-methylase SpoU